MKHRKLVYYQILKPHCRNNVLATVLKQQLEYWIKDFRDGFYKFLAPCQHRRYKTGDSWIGELNVSEHDFRVVFDRIGKRYKSIRQWQCIQNAGDDFFQERFYCSYFDARTGLRRYLRHHERLEILFQSIFQIRETVSICRDADRSVPSKVTKMTITDDTEITATVTSDERQTVDLAVAEDQRSAYG